MKNSQKGFAPLLIVLIAVIVIGGGIYYFQHSSQITVVDAVKDWTSYSNTKYEYSVSYPKNYSAVTYKEYGKEYPAEPDSSIVSIFHPENTEKVIAIRDAIEIKLPLSPSSIHIALDCGEVESCKNDMSEEKYGKFIPLTFGGGTGFKRIASTGYVSYFLQKNETSPVISINIGFGISEEQQKILSTFKFN